MNFLPKLFFFTKRAIFTSWFALLSAITSGNDFNQIETVVHHWEETLSAHIGVAVLSANTNHILWHYKGDQRVPLNSTFKTLACAKLLHDADQSALSLKDKIGVNQEMLVTYSPVLEKLINKQITLQDACEATMHTSDNTAANVVVTAVGGPMAITQFLRNLGDTTSRLDRLEPDLNSAIPGDVQDTTTPVAMVQTLNKLLFGTALTKRRQKQLKTWMIQNQVSDDLLRSVQPANWTLADRSGAGGYGSRSITAVAWSDTHDPILISIYLTRSQATFEQRNNAIAAIGHAIFTWYVHTTILKDP